MYRALGIHVRRCHCGGTSHLIAEVQQPEAIRAILTSMGLPPEPLPITPPRAPPDDDELDWAA